MYDQMFENNHLVGRIYLINVVYIIEFRSK
jgi:hypothetical protein